MSDEIGGENPAAFPHTGSGFGQHRYPDQGMSLRDYFAGQAMPAIIAATSAGQHFPGKGYEDDRPLIERMAEDAYKLASAMLAERTKK